MDADRGEVWIFMPFIVATLGLILALVFATDVAFRIGRWRRRREEDDRFGGQLGVVQGATLGLLALMLGFTMSMAEARFQRRREINVNEAAAVGTTYLRTQLLPEPQQSESRALLRTYVEERRAYYRSSSDEMPAVMARTDGLQTLIWQRAASAGNLHPDSAVLATYVITVNQMFDLEAARSLAVTARLPSEILMVVLLIAFGTVGITGFAVGFGGGRSAISLYAVPALIAITLAVTVDLDRSWFGFISTGDGAMGRVQAQIERDFRTSATP